MRPKAQQRRWRVEHPVEGGNGKALQPIGETLSPPIEGEVLVSSREFDTYTEFMPVADQGYFIVAKREGQKGPRKLETVHAPIVGWWLNGPPLILVNLGNNVATWSTSQVMATDPTFKVVKVEFNPQINYLPLQIYAEAGS